MSTTQERNWSRYNKSLTQEISLIFRAEEVRPSSGKGKGRSKVYPDSLIQQLAEVRHYLGLPYRQMEGFVKEFSSHFHLSRVPDYSTLCRREHKLGLEAELSDRKRTVAVDASGLKLICSGEWINKRHGKRKNWLKLHLAVDTETKEVVAWEISEGKVHDIRKFKELVEGSGAEKVLADGAYDSKDNFDWLTENGMKPGIRVRRNVSSRARGCVIRRQVGWKQKRDWDRWRDETGYGQRWQAETVFSLMKGRFGEWVSGRRKDSIRVELALKVQIHNRIIRSRP